MACTPPLGIRGVAGAFALSLWFAAGLTCTLGVETLGTGEGAEIGTGLLGTTGAGLGSADLTLNFSFGPATKASTGGGIPSFLYASCTMSANSF